MSVFFIFNSNLKCYEYICEARYQSVPTCSSVIKCPADCLNRLKFPTSFVGLETTRCTKCERNSINPLKPKLVEIWLNNSVRTAEKTQIFTVTKINWLTPFKEIIAVYCEDHTKPIEKNEGLLVFEAAGTCSYHWSLKS
jgi:hypothetical protein